MQLHFDFYWSKKISFVVDELMRVCSRYLIIETYPKHHWTMKTEYKEYDFKVSSEHIKDSDLFKMVRRRYIMYD